jgi:hypothetical protein
MTTFHHDQQFFHQQTTLPIPVLPQQHCIRYLLSSYTCRPHLWSNVSIPWNQLSYFLNNDTTTISFLYRVIILSDKYQSPLPVSSFTALINHSTGQKFSQSHILTTRTVPNHSLGPILTKLSQSEPKECYKHRLLQYSRYTCGHVQTLGQTDTPLL